MSKSYYGLMLEHNTEEDQMRIEEWAKSLDDTMSLGGGDDMDLPDDEGPNWGHDDSEEFRWEQEHKARMEARGHQYIPTNWSNCYEPEIMGRSNDSYSGLYQGER